MMQENEQQAESTSIGLEHGTINRLDAYACCDKESGTSRNTQPTLRHIRALALRATWLRQVRRSMKRCTNWRT